MTELELMELSQPLADIYMAMEEDLMVEIARRIAVSGEVIPTSEWRLKKLAEAGALNKKTIEIIAKYTGLQAETLTETIEAAAYGAIKDLEPAFQKVAEQGIISSAEVPASETTKRVVKNFRSQAASDLNLVNTVMQYKSREAYKALVNKTYKTVQAVENAKNRQELLNVLGKHTLSVVTGGESRQAAVRKCIEEFSEKGIPAFVDKAGREWSPEAYINMDIKTTVSNTARTAQEARFDEYGIDLIQVSSHNGARPKCAKDQGKLYSRSNKSGTAYDGDGNPIEFFPFSQTSFGQPDGLFGINCHHKEYAFISGVNFQRYFPYDEEENAAQYKKIQNQRRLERRVRETKRNIAMLKEVGDTEGVKLAKKTLAQRNKAYNDYCAENNLKPHSDRLAVVNAKAVKNAVKDIDNSGGSGIMKSNNFHDNLYEYKSITQNSIDVIPTINVEGLSHEQCLKLQEAHKDLLILAQKHPVGTEVSATYSMNMNRLGEPIIGKKGIVKIQSWDVDYIGIHNHPSGETLSYDDIQKYLLNANMKIISAVGNSGEIYALQKFDNSDVIGYNNYLDEILFKADFDGYSFNELISDDFDMSKIDINKCAKILVDCMNNFFEGAEKYGFKYYRRR